MENIVVVVLLVGLAILAIIKIIKNKKSGKSLQCGGNCKNCISNCSKNKKES